MVADFNQDGKEDLAAVDPWGTGSRLATIQALPAGGYGPLAGQYYGTNLSWPRMPLCHDLTGDGNADIVASFIPYSLLFPGTGSGQFGAPIPIPDPSGLPSHAFFAATSLSATGRRPSLRV